MGLLIPIVIGLFAWGCYAPALRDCTVSCEAPSDCATGQVCGSDGLCAAPRAAGRCADLADAGVPDDAATQDAEVVDAPGGPTTVRLRVRVGGKGSVVLEGSGTCASGMPQNGDCVYDITLGVLQRASAVSTAADHEFDRWATGPCVGQQEICTFRPVTATTIEARFMKIDD
jgi:hypothetical protein